MSTARIVLFVLLPKAVLNIELEQDQHTRERTLRPLQLPQFTALAMLKQSDKSEIALSLRIEKAA